MFYSDIKKSYYEDTVVGKCKYTIVPTMRTYSATQLLKYYFTRYWHWLSAIRRKLGREDTCPLSGANFNISSCIINHICFFLLVYLKILIIIIYNVSINLVLSERIPQHKVTCETFRVHCVITWHKMKCV